MYNVIHCCYVSKELETDFMSFFQLKDGKAEQNDVCIMLPFVSKCLSQRHYHPEFLNSENGLFSISFNIVIVKTLPFKIYTVATGSGSVSSTRSVRSPATILLYSFRGPFISPPLACVVTGDSQAEQPFNLIFGIADKGDIDDRAQR